MSVSIYNQWQWFGANRSARSSSSTILHPPQLEVRGNGSRKSPPSFPVRLRRFLTTRIATGSLQKTDYPSTTIEVERVASR